ALGFTVIGGGAHADGPTENALIPFPDGSYLELIAFRSWRTRALLRVVDALGLVERVAGAPLARRFALRAARGEGLIDWAVGVDTFAGLDVHGPVEGRRGDVAWELGIPDADELPMFI